MEHFVGIEICFAGDDEPGHKAGGHDGERECIKVSAEPVLDEVAGMRCFGRLGSGRNVVQRMSFRIDGGALMFIL
jgi:hypothetical protein